MLTRRLLLKIFGATLYLSLFRGTPAMAQLLFKPKDKKPPRIAPNRFIENGKSLVGISGAGDPYDMIKEAVSLIGGFETNRASKNGPCRTDEQ